MTDFKAGDKVKILKGRNNAAYTKGMEGIVARVVDWNIEPLFRVQTPDGDTWNYKEEELELIEEKKEFKMGDLVKVLKSNHGAPEETIGRRGIIRNTDGFPKYCVEFSHIKSHFAFHTAQWWYSEDELELAVSPTQMDVCSMYPSAFSDLKPIEEGMRILCKTKEEWEALLTNLELREYEWWSCGSRPTHHVNYFSEHHERVGAYVYIESNKRITWGNAVGCASHKLTPVSKVLDFNIGRDQTVNQPTNKEETTMINEIKEGQRVICEADDIYVDTSEGLLVVMIDIDGTTKVESIATGEKEWVNTKDLRSAEIQVGDFVEVVKNYGELSKGEIVEVIEVDEYDSIRPYKVKSISTDSSWVLHNKVKPLPAWHEVEREENIGSENGTLIVEQNYKTKELRITRGCFKKKTLAEFEEAVKRKPEGNMHRIVYEFLIKKYKKKYPQPVEKKYYVKLSDGLAEQIGNGGTYLNVLNDTHLFGTPTEVGSYITQFTKTEAEEWVEKLDKLELEIVEVEEEPQW